MRTVSTENKRVDLRRNDTVKVITGRDKGKEGRVLRVFPNDAKLLVEHVMMVKKHVRPNRSATSRANRGAGEPDCDLQRATGLRDLRPGTHWPRSARRPESAGVHEVRDDAG